MHFLVLNLRYQLQNTGKDTVWKNNGLMPEGVYFFGEDGKMVIDTQKNGILKEDGVLRYYVNGAQYYVGLIKIDGDYYYVNSQYVVVTGEYNVWKNNDLLPQGVYFFDEDGKLVDPPAELPMTYERYRNMSAEEQQAFRDTFESMEAFLAWYQAAKAAYESP